MEVETKHGTKISRSPEDMDKKRSRAYPVLDLGAAYELLCGKLAAFGDREVDREVLAASLGYNSSGGGVAARKISALVQYGLLDRLSGRYGLSHRGRRLQALDPASDEFLASIQTALGRPALFQEILEKYRPVGWVPGDLDRVLVLEFGITDRASEDAASIFLRSARFARVLDARGSFLGSKSLLPVPSDEVHSFSATPLLEEQMPAGDAPDELSMQLPLSDKKFAKLTLPVSMTEEDVGLLIDRLRFELDNDRLKKYLGLDKGRVTAFPRRGSSTAPLRH